MPRSEHNIYELVACVASDREGAVVNIKTKKNLFKGSFLRNFEVEDAPFLEVATLRRLSG